MRMMMNIVFGVVCVLLWLTMMYAAAIILSNSVAYLPDLPASTNAALITLYWVFPIWLIFMVLWYLHNRKLGPVETGMNAKQRKMLMAAQASVYRR